MHNDNNGDKKNNRKTAKKLLLITRKIQRSQQTMVLKLPVFLA